MRAGFICAISAISACSSSPKLPTKPTLQNFDSTTVSARERVDRFDPLVYCGADGALRCPSVTPKTAYVPPPPPAPVVDANVVMRDALTQLAPAAPADIRVEEQKKTVPVFSNVLFDFNKSDLSPAAQAQLRAMAQDLKGKGVLLAGFTDGIGAEAYNHKLALARARAVLSFLKEIGFPDKSLEIQGQGVCCYVAPNDSDESRRLNRRVEIRLTAK
jgi:outer membrane protein OmpA-like peptidoglycan-associated protein